MKELLNDAKLIYSILADEESKEIFRNRLLYNLTGENKFLDGIIRKYVFQTGLNQKGIISYLLHGVEQYQDNYPIVVYGCGEMGEKLYQELGEKVCCFCDKNIEKQKEGFCGKKVISLQSLIKDKEDYRVIIGSIDYYFEIYQNLKCNGVQLVYDNFEVIKQWNSVVKQQYFDKDIIKYEEKEIFVDGGCLNYETVKNLLKECSTVSMVYAFEPDADNAQKCRAEAGKHHFSKYKIIEKGLYNESAELRFRSMGNGCSGIQEDGECRIKVCAIDEEIAAPVTFIKMDIEGAEMAALQGAKETIKKYHPKLAICVYHKAEDIIEIPKYILNLNSEYKLYLRHYSDNAGETVLYAV